MLLALTVVILLIGTLLMANIYSVFFPFIKSMGSIADYNIAYYGAIGSLERAELTLKYHEPGFQGTGGWLGGSYGPASDSTKIQNFSKLTNQGNGMRWDISSRIGYTSIPENNKGNVDVDLQDNTVDPIRDDINFNKLEYFKSQQLAFYYDNTSSVNNYYKAPSASDVVSSSNGSFSDIVRMGMHLKFNNKMFKQFQANGGGYLTHDTDDQDADGATNDTVVIWSIAGEYVNGGDAHPFTIFPKTLVKTGAACPTPVEARGVCIYGNKDSINYVAQSYLGGDFNIREQTMNIEQSVVDSENATFASTHTAGGGNAPQMFRAGSSTSIIKLDDSTSIVGDTEVTNYLKGKKLLDILNNNSYIKKVSLKFSLVNKLKSRSGLIYPFLEYGFGMCNNASCDSLNGIVIPDRFFHINGQARVGDYNVQIKVDKPTFDTSVGSEFVILF